jgi:hypothetical protein
LPSLLVVAEAISLVPKFLAWTCAPRIAVGISDATGDGGTEILRANRRCQEHQGKQIQDRLMKI